MAQKPNVIIFGGINELAPVLALHLVPLSGEPLVSHLRIVDKYIMNPPTTYVIKEFPRLLQEKPELVDYRQANLTVAATVAKCFTDPAPNAQPYTHIIDLTGEESFDRTAEIFIAQTLNVSLSIAREAAKHSVKAYIRNVPAFYDQTVEKKLYKEEDADGWKPWGTRGVWWHETLRAIGNIPNLPLVVVRSALPYGPGYVRGDVTTVILLGLVYRHFDQEMKFLWSQKLPRSTINSLDWAASVWATALWAGDKDRAALNAALGVGIAPSGDKLVETTENAVNKATGAVTVPVVNLADESRLTQESMGAVISKVFDIKIGFHGSIASQFAKLKFDEMVEDVNEMHLNEWATIITTSNPAVPSTPLSPYASNHQLAKHGCALDGSKLKNVIGYTCQYPAFTEETVKQTIESWKSEGVWPNTYKFPPP